MSNLIETVKGKGTVFSGERLVAEVQYEVWVYQTYNETLLLSGQELRTPSFQNTELKLNKPVEADFNELLTLHLADGRKLNFWALGGECKATGGLYL
ncbi:MAG TPA: hypothetical protein VK302_07485 [Terriglobales bacterium]|nr:hypothetical protein [Terriglobales bacterium]